MGETYMQRRYGRIAAPFIAVGILATAPAAAPAQADIEAVWSFSGGQVAIQAAGDGTYTGTVIRQTTLATCPHVVGELMWLGVRPQVDGQYWGGHQYLRDVGCEPVPERGNTAYRVLSRPDGARFLRVCFSKPE